MKTQKFFNQNLAVSCILLFLFFIIPASIISQISYRTNDKLALVNNKSLIVKTTGEDDDKTLSPYFFVKSEGSETEQLPLKATSADVNIAGVIADVTVKQVYVNSGKNVIEAIYIFPASTRAAVYSMKMKVGDRLITAKIQEKQKARQEYDQAKSEGKNASLLEQQRPNVFQMNVANIMPGDTISIEMCYTELLIPEQGVYEFVYPTVVGPRYSNKPEATASTNDKWVSNPYTHAGEKPDYSFNIGINLAAGMPIKDVRCPSHEMTINYENPASAMLKLKNTGTSEGNRDVIVQYRLADNKIESGLLLYKNVSPGENFFLAMVQPPPKPTVDQIPPREYIFIMDVSGSMNGYPIETSKKVLENLIKNLRSTDKFNVLLFAGCANMFMPQSVFATEENLKKALKMIDEQQGSGGTELLTALKKALSVEKQKGFSRTFVIATDGYVDVEKESFELIQNNLNKANFFAFGIGSSVNRFLIEGIAHAGMGESFIVTKQEEADAKAEKFRSYIQSPVLTDIKVTYEGFDVYDLEPSNVPDVLAERPVIIFGKWKGNPTGKIKITGKSGKEDFEYVLDVSKAEASPSNRALKYLWARQKIRMLDDFNNAANDPKLTEQITGLGLKYNLLTNYTSFIAIDSIVRNKGGKQATVKQPLPLPENVSDYAVGGYGSASGNKSCMKVMPSHGVVMERKVELDDTEEQSPVVFNAVEEMPEFIGGQTAMDAFIKLHLVYPAEAKTKGISGTVYIEFTVKADGSVANVTVKRGIGGGCDEEAVRVVKMMNKKWKPGKQNGKNTNSKMTLPIHFQLK
ncbi:MAG TPA: TonB family protein [Bacteroidales bacterium]|nr:TonB family protein [Bacteroidales bacterium]